MEVSSKGNSEFKGDAEVNGFDGDGRRCGDDAGNGEDDDGDGRRGEGCGEGCGDGDGDGRRCVR